jgi:ABC-2 type transport system ATP-binding protein
LTAGEYAEDVSAASVIEIAGLVKRFGHTLALDGFDLTVAEGEIHGFLGPNGAGKSTTMRILLGLVRADQGSVRVFGADPWRDSVSIHRRLAYVPGDVSLWPNLTGGETIDFLLRSRGKRPEATRRDELVERFELDPRKRCRAYSKGNRQKVALIAALADDSPLLVLDEPTSGLDPLMEGLFRDCLHEASAAGRTVLLSSHILSEVAALCHQVTIVRDGRVVERGSVERLRHLRDNQVRAVLQAAPPDLSQIPGLHDLDVQGDTVSCRVADEDLQGLLTALSSVGVRSLESTPASLEDVFLSAYRDADTGAEP